MEFDSACCTAQQEDSRQLYIRNPASQQPRNLASPLVTSQSANTSLVKSQKYSPVLNKFSGKTNWPSHGVATRGAARQCDPLLETASGYECQDADEDGLKNLEDETGSESL